MAGSRHVFPGVLGVSILIWSWTVQLWPIGLFLAALLEAPRWLPWRFQVAEKQLVRMFKFFLFVVSAVFISLLVMQRGEGLIIFVQWLPTLLMPAILIQLYHQSEQFPSQLFIDSMISRSSYSRSPYPNNIDLQLPYILMVLIAISVSIAAESWVFLFFCFIVMFSLFHIRPKSFHYLKWTSLVSLSFFLAFFIKGGLVDLQDVAQELTMEWFSQDWSQRNMFNNQTAMGELGELKLSNKIVMRIAASEQQSLLLEQASYSHFISNSWHMQHSAFKDVQNKSKSNAWVLSNMIPINSENLSVSSTLKRGRGVLALPSGSYEIINNRAGTLSMNNNGSVRISGASTLLDYTVYYDGVGSRNYLEPSKADLQIPKAYREVIDEVAGKAGLIGVNSEEAAKKLGTYFENNFKYSLFQKTITHWNSPLEYFLRNSYQGHCEYFATSGALILRAVGIPTRYVTGFSMSEFDVSTQRYLVRQRHAHSWVQAYINGKWIALDYTPSTWAELEAQDAPWWLGVSDFFDLKFDDLRYWWEDDNDLFWKIMQLSIGVSLLIYITRRARLGGYKFSWRKKKGRGKKNLGHKTYSPFQEIIDYFEETVDQRSAEETLHYWLVRIDKRTSFHDEALFSLLNQHYKLIYGDAHWSARQLEKFSEDVGGWLLKRR